MNFRFKHTILFLLAFLLLGSAFAQSNSTELALSKAKLPTKNVWVFILAGQSNMAGRGTVEAQDTIASQRVFSINEKGEIVPAKEPIHFYEPKMKGLGCGLAFGKELLKHIPSDVTILLIPTAVGGSSINQWLKDANHRGVQLLSNFKEKVNLGKEYGEIKAVLWHQGESDANPDGIATRQDKLRRLFTQYREIVGNPTLPILMGELGSYSKDKELWQQMNDQIRQYAASDANTALISTSDFKDRGDKVHFNSEGQREMGKRFAREYIRKFGTRR